MEPTGSRIGIVFSGSPLFTGDAGSGESEIRKWIIENDWLETIVSLPERIFFNTSIPTFFMIITNKKSEKRKGKIQLIDGKSMYQPLKRNLGEKNREITEDGIQFLINVYQRLE
jgi:type I restriction enzyme M protein